MKLKDKYRMKKKIAAGIALLLAAGMVLKASSSSWGASGFFRKIRFPIDIINSSSKYILNVFFHDRLFRFFCHFLLTPVS